MIYFHIFLVINLAFLFKTVHGELFTAMVDLEALVETEEAVINIMEDYIRAEEHKINILKRYVDIYQKQHNKATEDVELYLSNPVNAYSIIKRLSSDWSQVETLLSSDTTREAIGNLTFLRTYVKMKFPTEEDLTGAVAGLVRLQHMYKLEVSSLAKGEINGVKYSSDLNADDCFEIGKKCFDMGDFSLTKLWMEEADARLKREIDKTIEYSEILEYLAYCSFEEGNISLALDLTRKLLRIVPTNPRALTNVLYYEEELKKTNTSAKSNDTSEEATNQEIPVGEDYLENYEALCRGELAQSAEYKAKLKCRYLSRNDPFLKIAPFKVEEAHLDPEVYIFHDVISDLEIETIKTLALLRFKRATVFGSGKQVFSSYRISKVAWLTDDLHPHVADISQRVTDMTGFSMESAEQLQVVNYGIGGYYKPHYDFYSSGFGDRIGTTLFYLSDVAQGGATVFPKIKVAVWPKKGTAAFWYNLHPSGDPDLRTRHAACPVLAGSKWVSTKWVNEIGQEFRRPCTQERPSNDTIFQN